MRAPSILLRVITALCLSPLAGCPVDPTPDAPQARLSASADEKVVNVTETTKITVRNTKADLSAGTGDITATISTVDEERATVTLKRDGDEGAFSDTATVAPDDDGRGVFVVKCDSTGSARIDFASDGLTASSTIDCVDQARTVTVNVADCANKLQADGLSSCKVDVTIAGAPDGTVGVTLGDVVNDAGASVSGGSSKLLKAALVDAAAATLPTLPLVNGAASFFIVSPAAGELLTIPLIVSDTNRNRGTATVTIKESNGRPVVDVAPPSSATVGGDAAFIITAKNPNGTPAAGAKVALTAEGGEFKTDATACVDEDGVATLDAAGACTVIVDIAAAAEEEVIVNATFLGVLDQGRVEVSAVGVLTVNIVPSTREIAANVTSTFPATSVISIEVKKDGPHEDVEVTATIESGSRGTLNIKSSTTGSSTTQEASASADVLFIGRPTDGKITITVGADNELARGVGTINIRTVDLDLVNPQPTTSTNVAITVDRDPVVSALVFDGFDTESVIGVRNSTGRDSSTGVRFKLLDEEGAPVAGRTILFTSQSSVPGVTLTPNAQTDGGGLVKTRVTAGTVAGPITVLASIEVNGRVLRTPSPPISVVGGIPNSSQSSFTCAVKAAFSPFTSECSASLADQFTMAVDTSVNVQFRAEGGNITPFSASSRGAAAATFNFSEPGPGSADLLQWSYTDQRRVTSELRTAFPGCFDATTRSDCDLIAICESNDLRINHYCPLQPSRAPANAGQPITCDTDISDAARAALDVGGDPDQDIAGEWDFLLGTGDVAVNAQFDAYLLEHRVCGFPLACLTRDRSSGLFLDGSDACPVSAGCLDFSEVTECPQNGLLDVLASVRGQEGFDDLNGDGLRNANEDFVDFPEPFLDKNSSCSFDDLNDSARLAAGEKVRLSDLFIDSDNGRFGFEGGAGQTVETNGTHDNDTEIFLKTTMVLLEGVRALQFGEAVPAGLCGANGATPVTCLSSDTGATIGRESLCTENARGTALLGDCRPVADEFREGESVNMAFRWTDANGNCPTSDFAGAPTIAVEGPATVTFDSAAYNEAECGAAPGAINASNVERPWCEEHPAMGSQLRSVQIKAVCGAEKGSQTVKLTFSLDGTDVNQFVEVGCPVCGDLRVEGDEQCDEASAACDPIECTKIAPG